MMLYSLVLFGLLTISQARPEAGYNYARPEQSLQLIHSTSSFQNLPQLNQHSSGLAPQLLGVGQNQQSLSYIQQQVPLQVSNSYGLPSPSAQGIISSGHNAPQIINSYGAPQVSVNQAQPSIYYQSVPLQASLNQNQQLHSYQAHVPSALPQQSFSYQLPQISLQNLPVSEQQSSYSVSQAAPASHQIHYSQNQLQYSTPQQAAVSPAVQTHVQTQTSYEVPQAALTSQSLPNIDVRSNFGQSSLSQSQVLNQNLPAQEIHTNALPVSESLHQLPVASQPQLAPQPNFVSQVQNFQAPSPLITKHVYFHVAPEDPELPSQAISLQQPAKKNYKIIFIKAPTQAPSQRQILQLRAAQQTEEKTLVYVLVDKSHHSSEINLPAPSSTQPSKPEVYFIKYKANNGAAVGPGAPGVDLGALNGGSLPIVEDRSPVQGQPITSGESTSTLFSGGVPGASTKYGPPGYQKREAKQ